MVKFIRKGIARDSYRAARNKEIQLFKEFLRGVFYSDDLGSRDKIADCQLFSLTYYCCGMGSTTNSEL